VVRREEWVTGGERRRGRGGRGLGKRDTRDEIRTTPIEELMADRAYF
jgi:hypothetical protein